MIGFIRGKVAQLYSDCCLVEVQGIGYRIYTTDTVKKQLSVGQDVFFYTYLNVREDALSLFGFLSHDEYQLFMGLISVNGIGPKVALGVLTAATPEQFRIAIASRDLAVLTKLPGIGKKTAERLILELKDKLGSITCNTNNETVTGKDRNLAEEFADEAYDVLTALGYTQAEVMPVLRKVYRSGQTVEETVRLALKEVGQR